MTRFILIGKANTISQQLAEMQRQGLVPSGPEIVPITSKPGWDGRKS